MKGPTREQAAGPAPFDLDKARALVATSGNRFQCKVANYFRARAWAVLLSPYYVDSSSDKTRELDLIVERQFPVPAMRPGPPKAIAVRLFIECKYIANGVVFWIDEMDFWRARDWICTNTNCFRPDNIYTNQHHYLTRGSTAAKLFETDKKQRGGEDIDPMFRTVNQCLNGYIHTKSRELLTGNTVGAEITQLNYPVVVRSSFAQFFQTHTAADPDIEPPTPMQDNFGLEVNYAYVIPSRGAVKQYFLVDVLDFAKLDDFLQAIAVEVQGAINMIRDV